MTDKLELLLEFEGKIPSVNSLYTIARARGGGGRLILSNEARHFKDVIKQQISKLVKLGDYPFLKDNHLYTLRLEFIIKSGYQRRDTSNMIKAVEDCLFEVIKQNDSRVVRGIQDKYSRLGGEKEFIKVILYPTEVDPHKYTK